MTSDEVRQQALDRVFREHPDWVGVTDSDTLAKVQQLQETYVGEISLAREIEELRRKQFAEEARRQGEAAREERAAEARAAAESARAERQAAEAERERERQERLAQMNPVSRTIRRHLSPIGGALVLAVLAVITVGVVVLPTGQDTTEEAPSSASEPGSSSPTVPETSAPTETANVVEWEAFNCVNYSWYQKKFSIRWNNLTGRKQTVTISAKTNASAPYRWTDVIPPGESVETYATGSANSGDRRNDGGLACDSADYVSVS